MKTKDGALLVYDITDAASFEKVKSWIKELKKIVGPNICISICGNKSDLEKHRTVNAEKAIEFANSVGATHHLTSAKTDKNLEETFVKLTEKMIAGRSAKGGLTQGGAGAGRGASRTPTIMLIDEPVEEKKKGCC